MSAPKVIRRKDPTRIAIEWQEGADTVFSAAELRRLCPCAHCIHELTGAKLLDPESIPDDMTHENVRMVGNYAIAVRFSDGHDTGIFPFPFLRENGPQR
jgi:DUF971 family protein